MQLLQPTLLKKQLISYSEIFPPLLLLELSKKKKKQVWEACVWKVTTKCEWVIKLESHHPCLVWQWYKKTSTLCCKALFRHKEDLSALNCHTRGMNNYLINESKWRGKKAVTHHKPMSNTTTATDPCKTPQQMLLITELLSITAQIKKLKVCLDLCKRLHQQKADPWVELKVHLILLILYSDSFLPLLFLVFSLKRNVEKKVTMTGEDQR